MRNFTQDLFEGVDKGHCDEGCILKGQRKTFLYIFHFLGPWPISVFDWSRSKTTRPGIFASFYKMSEAEVGLSGQRQLYNCIPTMLVPIRQIKIKGQLISRMKPWKKMLKEWTKGDISFGLKALCVFGGQSLQREKEPFSFLLTEVGKFQACDRNTNPGGCLPWGNTSQRNIKCSRLMRGAAHV